VSSATPGPCRCLVSPPVCQRGRPARGAALPAALAPALADAAHAGILQHPGRVQPKPETTFGNVKADVLERFVPGYQRANFVEIIKGSDWPK
jgi:hypothetical protein